MQDDSLNSKVSKIAPRRFRSAPKVWQNIIKSIINESYSGEGITYDMIEAAAKGNGHSISRQSLRVKMARYSKSGYIRPVIDPQSKKRVRGAFWLTEQGKLFFSLETRYKGNLKKTTAMLPTSPSKWSQLALKINQADTDG